ncbi:MAG: carbohydrate kinase family protein [Bacteroidales bacterium]|nr:carbohydrate kinase family protein [Bacteroidales bacterium]
MRKEYDAVVAGYTCVDLIPDLKKHQHSNNISDFFKPGKIIEIGGMDFVLGGVVPNTGIAMKKFGSKVFLNGLIGNDFIGKTAESQLARYGATEGMVVSKEGKTAFSIVIAPPGVDRIFLESPGCNQDFDITHINFEMVSKARLFHFGYPPLMRQFFLDNGRKLIKMYSKIQKMGVVTSLDFSLPDPESESGKVNWQEILDNTLPFVDIFVPSLEELMRVMMPQKFLEIQAACENSDFEDEVPFQLVRELGKQMITLGVSILLIKMGKRGVYLCTGDISQVNKKLGNTLQNKHWTNQEILCNSYTAEHSKIKNASGAGDIAIAAFLTSILNADNPGTAIKYAAIAGRDSLYCQNIFKGMTSWEELTHKISSESNELIFLNSETFTIKNVGNGN